MNDILDKTIDNGTIENIQIAPVGEFNGSGIDGSAIKENITVEKLESLADKLNKSDEVLCDVDHQSCKVGVEKNSKAAGWFSKWIVDPIKGLFATLSLTKYGRDLLENREYRYVSPVFSLNEDGTVSDLHSVALTNTPAFKGYITPIINSESSSSETNENLKEEILDMTKEELKELITSIISDMRATEKAQEIQREVVEEIVENECSKELPKEEVVKNEVPEEETTTEEVVETTTEEVPEEKVEEKKEEIIKIESLNSAPMIKDVEPIWKKLTGQEFLDWANKHANYKI